MESAAQIATHRAVTNPTSEPRKRKSESQKSKKKTKKKTTSE
jgi:hypothetical protein